MHPLEREICIKVFRDKLIREGEQGILVAVSGGPDSVALLHVLQPLRREKGISLAASYIDHGLRPAEAEPEERFVRALCGELGVLFESARVDVRAHAGKNRISLEHAARDLRYEALRTIAGKHHASLIAVAHTADDQAEEVLIRLLRGSGMKGLSGMLARSGDIIRPLLSVDKDTILRYLEDKKQTWRLDSSNADETFVRNRVRHSLIPFLEESFEPGVRAALRKVADSLAQDEKLLDDLAAESFRQVVEEAGGDGEALPEKLVVDRKKFVVLPVALRRRVVEKLLWRLRCPARYDHIVKVVEAAETGRTGSEIHLGGGLRVGVQREFLEFLYPLGRMPWRGKLYNRREAGTKKQRGQDGQNGQSG